MSGLRFCMLTTFYPPHSFGGDAIGVQRLSRGLVRQGHHVTVVHDKDAFNALHPGPPRTEESAGDGVEVVGLVSGLGALSPLLTQQLGRPVVNGRRIRAILESGSFDVVNFHNVSLVGGPGILRYAGDAVSLYMAHEHWLVCPMHVLWRHGRELCDGRECVRCTLNYRRPPQVWRHTGFLEREIQRVDAVIAMSEFSREKHREFGFNQPMEVLPYFLPDPESTRVPKAEGTSPHHRPYFFFAGRLERIKGLDDVIPLFRDFPEADLVIAGDGEHGGALRALAESIPSVRFVGRLSSEELGRYYRHSIATLVPSLCFETFGIVLIESFREATPVIARRLGPLPEIVEEAQGGELFETSEQLLASMKRLARDPEYRRQLGESSFRSFLEKWTESAVVPRYLDIVRRAAERRGNHRVLETLSGAGVA